MRRQLAVILSPWVRFRVPVHSARGHPYTRFEPTEPTPARPAAALSRSWLGWCERRFRSCAVRDITPSSPLLTGTFLSAPFTFHCISSLSRSFYSFST